MPEQVSVNKVLWRGRLTVTLPLIVLSLGIVIVAVYKAANSINRDAIGVAFLIALPLVPIVHTVLVTKWYIWALGNVGNVHELQQRIVFEWLLNNDTVFAKMVVSKNDKELVAALEKKFDVPGELMDDAAISSETKIYLAKAGRVFMLAVMLVCFAAGIVLVSVAHSYIGGSILCIISAYIAFDSYKIISDNKPQIIINDEGIETASSGFHSWKEIRNEQVGSEMSRNKTDYYLAYNFNGGDEKIYLYGIRTNHWRLAKLLRVYRGRNIQVATAPY
jgi:hypothetical protein